MAKANLVPDEAMAKVSDFMAKLDASHVVIPRNVIRRDCKVSGKRKGPDKDVTRQVTFEINMGTVDAETLVKGFVKSLVIQEQEPLRHTIRTVEPHSVIPIDAADFGKRKEQAPAAAMAQTLATMSPEKQLETLRDIAAKNGITLKFEDQVIEATG